MSLKLADVIKNTQAQILAGISEALAAGVHILPPAKVSVEVGLCHESKPGPNPGDPPIQGFRVADFNDVVVARVHLEIDVFPDRTSYEKALTLALDALEPDPFAGPEASKKKTEPKK